MNGNSIHDYYSIMGVSPEATEEDLRQAYRVLTKRYHPDVNRSPGASLAFKDINAAYEVLSDIGKRNDYDRQFRDRKLGATNLGLQVYYSRHYLKPLSEPQLLYVLVKAQPKFQTRVNTDAPLNICLVIDRSKSMAGTRLQHVKSAANRIIDETKPNDLLSMVVFSDDAEVIISAQHPDDPRAMKAMISTIRADGATAMLAGLRAGLSQLKRNHSSTYVSHLVLITDGRTYGDEQDCLNLAQSAREDGIGISGMGIGEDWNDRFLDALALQTGGSSGYITSPEVVTQFLQDRIRSLASAYAERSSLVAASSTGVELSAITRLSPNAISMSHNDQPVPMGVIDGIVPTIVMLQYHVTTANAGSGPFEIGRVALTADLLGTGTRSEKVIQDLSVQVSNEDVADEPPPELLDALSKLMLYKLQDRAREAIDLGDVMQATKSLEFLATRLFEAGEEDLGQAAMQEARRVAATQVLSDEGAKRLKYGTRALLPPTDILSGDEDG
jgi:Ca-activated chloride channel family protein